MKTPVPPCSSAMSPPATLNSSQWHVVQQLSRVSRFLALFGPSSPSDSPLAKSHLSLVVQRLTYVEIASPSLLPQV